SQRERPGQVTLVNPPIIGLTAIAIAPAKEYGSPRLGLNQTYVDAVARAGGAPLLIPHLADESLLRALYERLDGLLLTGGEDIDPIHFGEPIHEKCGSISAERDSTELRLTRWAAAEGKPVLAICRGIQVLNVALGGSLYQDIAAQLSKARRHDWYPGFPRNHLAHSAQIAPGTRLATIAGTETLQVNSLHHQSLKDVAPGLVVTAVAPDGVVEAVEASEHPFALGVQWHPEELAGEDARARRLFVAFVEASRR
ncbi:MAG TPA: gamma-glutamyl-gamma-aminobutyrate hydrolase family protein, partial [Anaerolineae bacterium]|nr:gamma-glutamyl-gamma-aminobutyrate hydrolase family protein [Anaerolineae bacterium]